MPRDSLFGERIIWTGRPKVSEPSRTIRAISALLFALSVISLSFAVVISFALKTPPIGPLFFSMWCAALGVAARQLPRLWLENARYVITENHVITIFGPFRRTIERKAISFARIFWHPRVPNAGDLELVRAVPTGALRRRLMLRLTGVSLPDRVWAIVRGAEDVAPLGNGDRPLAQRLDRDERVMWSARPRPKLRTYLPHSQREWASLAISGFLLFAVGQMVKKTVPALEKVTQSGLPVRSFEFLALVFGLTLAVALVLAVACYVAYVAVIRPATLMKDTRYLITNKRVLIQRDLEELHLGRERIVDVIDTPAGDGVHHLFMVLDGPRARALAASGAFGELGRGPHLRPVFEAVEDAEGASQILRQPSNPELPHAA